MFEPIEYEVAGRAYSGILATPAIQPRGGVLVLHGGGGLAEHERDRVRMLAALGYVALAPDLFGEAFTERSRAMALIGELVTRPAAIRARVGAAWGRLCAVPGVQATRTAAVGHCFGGFAALELARSGAGVRAVVSLHGGLTTHAPAVVHEVRARVLVCTGADDPFCPRERRAAFEDEMTAAGVDWQLHTYAGARHGFTVPASIPRSTPDARTTSSPTGDRGTRCAPCSTRCSRLTRSRLASRDDRYHSAASAPPQCRYGAHRSSEGQETPRR